MCTLTFAQANMFRVSVVRRGGGASTTGGNLRVVRKRGKEKLRRIKRSPDGTKCGFIRSFDLSLITLLFTFKHTLMSGLKQKLFIL